MTAIATLGVLATVTATAAHYSSLFSIAVPETWILLVWGSVLLITAGRVRALLIIKQTEIRLEEDFAGKI